MIKAALFFTLFLSGIFYGQEVDLSGKWEAVNQEYNYKVNYKIEKLKKKYRGLVTYFEMNGEKYSFSEKDQIEILKDLRLVSKDEITGKYLDTETNQEYTVSIEIIDKNNLKLIVKDGDESLTEDLSRIID